MRISSTKSFLVLLLFTTSAVARPVPHAPHKPHEIDVGTQIVERHAALQPKQNLSPKSVQSPQFKVTGLPEGWAGVFVNFQSCRPSIPVAATFIRFFRMAGQRAADTTEMGQALRFSYGTLVLEFVSEELITKEFLQAAALFLLNKAQMGWMGLFEAWIKDLMDGSVVYLRMGTIWDLPDVISTSPWD